MKSEHTILFVVKLSNGHTESIECETMAEARRLAADAKSVKLECQILIQ